MRFLTINGERKIIPSFPHHKDYVYRCYKFFELDTLYSFATVNGKFRAFREYYNDFRFRCMIPRELLIDPTSSCNLKCKGCWAGDYSENSNISFEKLDEILTEARKLGVMDVLMSGGEPLMRKEDIIKLCRKHRKLMFALFTNGTLIDKRFADELAALGNLNVFLSIEGFREQTDFRRGNGTFDKVIAAMDLLRERDIGFGFSACYHSKNYDTIASDEFLDFMREKGAWFGWLFNYIPVGRQADLSLVCKAQERKYVKEKIEQYWKKHKYALIDFANAGHKAFGCVAAGNDFIHINADGDVEPCAFCHYSDSNIYDSSLLEALRSPFLRNFRRSKPFSENNLRPCPMVDVPEAIVKLTQMEGVKSTHKEMPETGAELATKTTPFADDWKPLADQMFEELEPGDKRRILITTTMCLKGKRFVAGENSENSK